LQGENGKRPAASAKYPPNRGWQRTRRMGVRKAWRNDVSKPPRPGKNGSSAEKSSANHLDQGARQRASGTAPLKSFNLDRERNRRVHVRRRRRSVWESQPRYAK